jgi:hypothetical protein
MNESLCHEIIAPLDYREKTEAWQWRFGYELMLKEQTIVRLRSMRI